MIDYRGLATRVVDEVSTIAPANATLSDYHRERRRTLARD